MTLFLDTRVATARLLIMAKKYRHFSTTAAEHNGISSFTGKQSAISDHLFECNCSIEYHFDILAPDAKKFRVLIKNLFIKLDQPQLKKTTIKSVLVKLFD